MKKKRSIYNQYIFFMFFAPLALLLILILIGWSKYLILQHNKKLYYTEEVSKISEVLDTTFNYISEFSRVAGEKIIALQDINSESVAKVLQDTISISKLVQDVFNLNLFDFTVPSGYVIATTVEGALGKDLKVDLDKRLWMKLAPKNPWRILISSPDESIVSNRMRSSKIIPVGFGITNIDNKFLGTISSGIDVNKLTQTIKRNISNSVNFIILNDKLELIASSVLINDQKEFNKFLVPLKNIEISSNDFNFISTKYFNESFNFCYKLNQYPFIILLGENKAISAQEFRNFVLPDIIQSSCIGLFLLMLLIFFKNKIVKPLMLLAYNARLISKGNIHIEFPEPNNLEEEKLIEALELVKESFKLERRMRNKLQKANKKIKSINNSLEYKVT
ncbi:MAG: cache domain-containing protein, partial [Alphaproteobacteria bacterium]